MIDPTTIPITPAMPTTWNAWHLVALGVGAFITHAYHTIVNAGGAKKIAGNFWNGPAPKPSTINPQPPTI
jgi:hypothetical protein